MVKISSVWLLLLGLLSSIGCGSFEAPQAATASVKCVDFENEKSTIWSVETRRKLEVGVQTVKAMWTSDASTRLSGKLDRLVNKRWTTMHEQMCSQRLAGELSGVDYAATVSCLSDALARAEVIISTLQNPSQRNLFRADEAVAWTALEIIACNDPYTRAKYDDPFAYNDSLQTNLARIYAHRWLDGYQGKLLSLTQKLVSENTPTRSYWEVRLVTIEMTPFRGAAEDVEHASDVEYAKTIAEEDLLKSATMHQRTVARYEAYLAEINGKLEHPHKARARRQNALTLLLSSSGVPAYEHIWGHATLAIAFEAEGNIGRAVEAQTRALELTEDFLEAPAFLLYLHRYLLGTLLLRSGDHEGNLALFSASEELGYLAVGRYHRLRSRWLEEISTSYTHTEQWKKSLHYMQRAIAITQALYPGGAELIRSYYSMGALNYRLEHLDVAEQHLNSALQLLRDTNTEGGDDAIGIHRFLAYIYRDRGSHDLANQQFHQSYREAENKYGTEHPVTEEAQERYSKHCGAHGGC